MTLNTRDFIARTMSEEQLGEHCRSACQAYGWRFLWLRKTFSGAAGILDLTLIPLRDPDRRHVLFRELKGYDARGRLGRVTDEQAATIAAYLAAGQDAAIWIPDDWVSGRIESELS